MGPLPAALAPRLSDHLCQVYDGVSELSEHAGPYLADGIAVGQRAVVIAPAGDLGVARTIADAVVLDSAGGRVDVLDLGRIVGGGDLDVRLTLRWLDAALASALEQGCTGLRVVTMLTRPATEPFLRQALGAWEHAVGEWQSLRPVASACCFDRSVLGDKAVQEFACLHPRVATTGPGVPFRLYFRAGQLVLEGEVDSFSAPLLAQALTHVRAVAGKRLLIDAQDLRFINHRGLAALVDGLARRCGGVTLLGAPALVTRLRPNLGVGDEVLDVLPCPW